MIVRLLGTAAGGGFPQWNCNCVNCRGVRTGNVRTVRRSQSCVAISTDGRHWYLFNASPDIHAQIEATGSLTPHGDVRGSNITGILLTNSDLDHTLGLFLLREAGQLTIYAPAAVRRDLEEGLNLSKVLNCYANVAWIEPPAELSPLCDRDGRVSGMRYAAFPVPGKAPRYREQSAAAGNTIGYRVVDVETGGRLAFVPGIAALNEDVLRELDKCDVLLIDGTFWSDDEMLQTGPTAPTATAMGHVPVGGSHGSLAQIAKLTGMRKIYTHINNTNPMLREESPEREAVLRAGFEIGYDGLEFHI